MQIIHKHDAHCVIEKMNIQEMEENEMNEDENLIQSEKAC